jgi:hypothetical protein
LRIDRVLFAQAPARLSSPFLRERPRIIRARRRRFVGTFGIGR